MVRTEFQRVVQNVDTSCPYCKTKLTVGDESSDQQVRCPRCDHRFNPHVVDLSESPTRVPSLDVVEPAATAPSAGPSCASGLGGVRDDRPPSPAASEHWLMRTPEGRQYGPVDRAVLDQWVGEGRVSAECQLNGKGGPAWQPAARVYPVLNETEASSHSPVLDKSPPRRGVRRGRLILGLALAGCVFPPLSLWAAVIGTRDLRRMQLGSLHARDENLTRAGQIIATVASMIWTGVFAVGLFLLLLSAVRSV